MGLHAVVGDTGARIDTPLDHEIPILKQSFTEANIIPLFLRRGGREIKENN